MLEQLLLAFDGRTATLRATLRRTADERDCKQTLSASLAE